MSDSQLRAKVLMEEAYALGMDLADLIAADTTSSARIPTIAAYLATIVPTFTAATAATYRPYWRLAVDRVGDRRLVEVTIEDLLLVVTDAEAEPGARRQGALNLRRIDLDPKRATVWLREKGDSGREQPVSASLVALLEAHHDARAPGDVDGPVFRTADGRPMSARRYDTLSIELCRSP